MSVQLNTYVILGVRIPFKEFKTEYNDIEPYLDSAFGEIHHHNGLCVIYDGMNGMDVFIGKVQQKTGNYEGFDGPVEILICEGSKLAVAELIYENFGIDNPDVRVWVYSHYR